jgi:hypothetical protein
MFSLAHKVFHNMPFTGSMSLLQHKRSYKIHKHSACFGVRGSSKTLLFDAHVAKRARVVSGSVFRSAIVTLPESDSRRRRTSSFLAFLQPGVARELFSPRGYACCGGGQPGRRHAPRRIRHPRRMSARALISHALF